MGRNPCCVKEGLNKGAWTAMEDRRLVEYVMRHGEGKWRNLPKEAGLKRCGKSCRLRWLNYLRPDIKRGNISPDEEDLIIRLHRLLGNKWSLIAGRLPGRTDNEIKNYWNTNLSKKLGSNKNIIKKLQPQPQQNSTHLLSEKNKEFPLIQTHKSNSNNISYDMVNKNCTASNPEVDRKEDSWSLDEGELDLDLDFNLDDIIKFMEFIGNPGASSSNADDHLHTDSASLVLPEYDLPLQGEIIDDHHESNDFTSLFDDDHWLLEEVAWGCLKSDNLQY